MLDPMADGEFFARTLRPIVPEPPVYCQYSPCSAPVGD